MYNSIHTSLTGNLPDFVVEMPPKFNRLVRLVAATVLFSATLYYMVGLLEGTYGLLFRIQCQNTNFGRNPKHALTHELVGYMFNERGRSYRLSARVTSEFVHDFTPYVSSEAERRFVDPAGGNVFHVMSPAVTYLDER